MAWWCTSYKHLKAVCRKQNFSLMTLMKMCVSWQSLMTSRCAHPWTAVPSGGPPAPVVPPSLKPSPREMTHLSSALLRIFAPSCLALKRSSVASKAGYAPSPPPATMAPQCPARSTCPSRQPPAPRVGRRTMRVGSPQMEVLWLRPVTLTQTMACGSWCPVWMRWRTTLGKEPKSLSSTMKSLPPGQGASQEMSWLHFIPFFRF